MDDPQTTLDDLRREIDSIDTELHGLLKKRASLVENVRAVKNRDSIATVRPGREAAILRRLAESHEGGFPWGAIARIWREIIAGTTKMEMPEYAIAVYATDENQGCWDLARDQFGSATPMTAYATTREVLAEVSADRATIGVLPYPREVDTEAWWTHLMAPDGLRVAYRLPFNPDSNARSGDGGPDALAFGRIAPEDSGSDRTLIMLETRETVSRDGLVGLLERAGIEGRPAASHRDNAWFHLLDAKGFIAREDPRITELAKLAGVAGVSVIGAYAEPLALSAGEKASP
jgi:chorismate mutase/prephenate dehydratase